jgi:FHA domain-containing protein
MPSAPRTEASSCESCTPDEAAPWLASVHYEGMRTDAKPVRLQYRDGARFQGCEVKDSAIIIGGRHGQVRVRATVSRQQARVFREDGTVWIEDLGGDRVWVNGARVERVRLANRDKLKVGGLELEFWEG